MSITSEVRKIKSPGNGVTFTHPFTDLEIFAKSELLVLKVTAAGVVTILAEGAGSTNYAITTTTPLIDGKSDGFLTFPANSSTPLPTGDFLLIIRAPDLLQGTVFAGLGVQLPKNVETALDKMEMQILSLQEQLDRATIGPNSVDPAVSFELPKPAAGQTWRWNSDADGLEAVSLVQNAAVAKDNFIDLLDTPANYVGHMGKFLKVNAGETAVEFATDLGTLHVRDEKADGTVGGTPTANAWTKRTLNTVKQNSITGASLATDQITLPAGTYQIYGHAPFHRTTHTQLRLRNITASATVLVGPTTHVVDAVGNVALTNPIAGVVILAATAALELQYFLGSDAGGTNGLGLVDDTASAEVEVYAELVIRKVA